MPFFTPTFTVNAQQDRRQDNRVISQANTNVFAPVIAHPGATVRDNTLNATARAESDQRHDQGFTGRNAQNTLIALGAIAIVGGGAFVLLKSRI